MQTADDLAMIVSHKISRTALVLDSVPYCSPGQCFHLCGQFEVCCCPSPVLYLIWQCYAYSQYMSSMIKQLHTVTFTNNAVRLRCLGWRILNARKWLPKYISKSTILNIENIQISGEQKWQNPIFKKALCDTQQFWTYNSRGSAATHLRYGGQCYMGFVANFILFLAVKKFWRLVPFRPN